MHAVVMDSLEEYLSGTLNVSALRQVDAHLASCAGCRDEVAEMRQVSAWVGSLRIEEPLEPAPGFYARVMQEVGDRKPAPTLAGLFGLDFAFARRVAFACLLTLAVLGSYLITRESSEPSALSPEVVMAQQDAPTFDSAQAHEAMLATLNRYEP